MNKEINIGIDFNNIDQMAEDIWLFLTSDKLPEKATIKKSSFLHEVKIMIDVARQHHAKTQSIAYNEWIKDKPKHKTVDKGLMVEYVPYTNDELYTQFIESQTLPKH